MERSEMIDDLIELIETIQKNSHDFPENIAEEVLKLIESKNEFRFEWEEENE